MGCLFRWDIFPVATFVKSWNINLRQFKDQILDCGWELNWREAAFWGKNPSVLLLQPGSVLQPGGSKTNTHLRARQIHLKSLFRELTKWRKFEEPVACHVYLTLGMAGHLLLWHLGWYTMRHLADQHRDWYRGYKRSISGYLYNTLVHHGTLSRPSIVATDTGDTRGQFWDICTTRWYTIEHLADQPASQLIG